jgi:hypothetical protein
MNILDAIICAQGGGSLSQLAQNFGLSQDQAKSGVAALLPALSSGLKRNAASPGGAEQLLAALSGGQHSRYLDEVQTLGSTDTVSDGNSILGHILGSKDVSRNVAKRAAQQSGLGEDLLKKMLPVVATMVMGSLSKQTSSAGLQARAGSGGGLLDALTPMLDADGDGSVADDVFNLAKGFFR